MSVNIDGVPIFTNSLHAFWPILVSVDSITVLRESVLCVAIYAGLGKSDANDLVNDFINECEEVIRTGIVINNITFQFGLLNLICDLPAKASVLYIKNHSGYFACSKCCQEGDYIDGTTCYPEINNIKRNNNSFRRQTQIQLFHSKEKKSFFEKIVGFDMVEDVPIDYMHCVLLGVVKRLIAHSKFGWVHGKPPFKLRTSSINSINVALKTLHTYIPREFARKPRNIQECKRFKATEFRLLLLYIGPVIFTDYLSV